MSFSFRGRTATCGSAGGLASSTGSEEDQLLQRSGTLNGGSPCLESDSVETVFQGMVCDEISGPVS